MKMVKSLLLGSAAGLVAVASGQAADLPVKAKAVEYVKICSLYGAGFYYIPGTDICLKVGGYMRVEGFYNYGANGTTGIYNSPPSGQQDRIDGHDFLMRGRAYISTDSRQQTAYGVLRTYFNLGASNDSPASWAMGANRGFIQFAGFTFGLAGSFYDYFQGAATSYLQAWTSDTGDGGWKVVGYTAQLGSGLSMSIAAEEPRRTTVWNTSTANQNTAGVLASSVSTSFAFASALQVTMGGGSYLVGAAPLSDTIKIRFPDIVANIRLDQAWGGLQIMGALHDASGGYYGNSSSTSALGSGWNNGHPSDKLGWAAGAGVKINTPMISAGDYLQAQVNYTVGATKYTAHTPTGGGSPAMFNGNSLGLGMFSDGVYCGSAAGGAASIGCPAGAGSIELTTGFGVNAAYEHFWTPALRTSLVYSYNKYSYNSNAQAMITAAVQSNSTGTCLGGAANSTSSQQTISTVIPAGGISNLSNCDANWSYWSLGSRTQWNITKDFYMGVDVMYSQLKTAFNGTASYRAAVNTGAPTGTYTIADQSNWAFRYRIHRDIVP